MPSEYTVNEEELCKLREKVRLYLTPKRFAHTLAVESEAESIGKIFLPEKIGKLKAAALLHDVTKKDDLEKQLQYCRRFGIIISNSDKLTPKTYHAKTAAALIKYDFPEFADEEIISGVRWHTTGRAGMSIFESVVYLADYIEQTRTFPTCLELRNYFYNGLGKDNDNIRHLFKTMVKSFDFTMEGLISEGSLIDCDTNEARNFFLGRLYDNDR